MASYSIQTADGEFGVKLADVVLIEPIKSSFWKRFDGNLSSGLSFTKASDVLQYSLGVSATYRTLQALTDLSLNTIVTSKTSAIDQ